MKNSKVTRKITHNYRHPLSLQGMDVACSFRTDGEMIVREVGFEGPEKILRTHDLDAARRHWTRLVDCLLSHGFVKRSEHDASN